MFEKISYLKFQEMFTRDLKEILMLAVELQRHGTRT
jgi:hypothetical protein